GSALLIEFPSYAVPINAEFLFHELSVMNVPVVIAHPERNGELAHNPERLEALCAKGAVTQITAGSLLGEFGRAALAAAEEFHRRGLVHTIASDAHSLSRRPPRMAAARRWVEKRWGSAKAIELFGLNVGGGTRAGVVGPWNDWWQPRRRFPPLCRSLDLS